MSYQPKVLTWDIEVTPTLCWAYEMYDTNIVRKEKDWFFQSFAYKWLHEKQTHVVALPDFKGYKPRAHEDEKLLRELHKILSQADVLVAHNGNKFDWKKANARFIMHGLDPIPVWKMVDTLQVARRHFAFTANSLDALCSYFGIGEKKYHHSDLWYRCYEGDEKAWKEMKEYNKHDVVLGEKLYLKLRPWITNHPNMNALTGDFACPACGSKHYRRTHRRHITLGGIVHERFSCIDCGKNFQSKTGEKVAPILARN